MILTKEMLTKTLKKGRLEAILTLQTACRIAKLPEPHFEYEASGSTKRRWHFYRIRFRIPKFLQDADKNMMLMDLSNRGDVVFGSGKDTNKQFAKSLAALEVVHKIEEALDMERNALKDFVAQHDSKLKDQQAQREATPVTQEIQGVSWVNLPIDPQFPDAGERGGRITFSANVLASSNALLGGRAITLSARDRLPLVEHHSNHRDEAQTQNWANVQAKGLVDGVNGPVDKDLVGLSKQKAEQVALERIGISVKNHGKYERLLEMMKERPDSFGMAKLFVQLPKHRFEEIQQLVEAIEKQADSMGGFREKTPFQKHYKHKSPPFVKDNEKAMQRRIVSFRSHQQKLPLPVDKVEKQIPRDATVTIVRGGTGSGKTTRYPLMLSLFHKDAHKIVVAQPRRLACQTAAQRVAYEQDFQIGEAGCPIGYSIRFESRPSRSNGNSVDFETPGVILRRATQDPLLSSITDLVIDEVHERNSDMDMLLALAQQAQAHRRNHPTLPPLRIILMSATLDTAQWEQYFDNHGKIAVVDVPDARRFPIDIIHPKDKGFPSKLSASKWLMRGREAADDDLDENLCRACAELILHLQARRENAEDGKEHQQAGSILCFLPGMEEILRVNRIIRDSRQKVDAKICFLHSSLDSNEQAQVFRPGPKIILSTNIAETSLTIPDVKIVIDSGRERQHSLMESTSDADTTSVVGSLLATVDISQASAKQRAGRAGRVSAGTVYRLYTKDDFESRFSPFTLPEMQRMEISQLVLHSLSLFHPSSGHPLSLLLGAPDPPPNLRLRQTLHAMSQQSLVTLRSNCRDLESLDVELTPLGSAAAAIPASPRIARMLFMGLALCAIDSALTIAALLLTPKAFKGSWVSRSESDGETICSDVVSELLKFEAYVQNQNAGRKKDQKSPIYDQALQVRRQLEKSVKDLIPETVDWDVFNSNNDRVAAQVALICGATPHIAHLVSGRGYFATRDVAGTAKIHPSSINFANSRRTHWYLYHELRTTTAPLLHVTTAASPLELALFCDSSAGIPGKQEESSDSEDEDLLLNASWEEDDFREEWLYIADQWVPVSISAFPQRKHFVQLRRVLNYHMLNHLASDPASFVGDNKYKQLVLCILSCIEQQRIAL